jgi:UDP-N-acetylglucosamine:LPS N-acetylglucosamine transferase
MFVLVLGGSLGAQQINNAVEGAIHAGLLKGEGAVEGRRVRLLWQTGDR